MSVNRIPRCNTCNGPILCDKSCLHCGRSPEPERVSLGEALLGNAVSERATGEDIYWYDTPRQRVPIEVSIARAEAWLRGETAP